MAVAGVTGAAYDEVVEIKTPEGTKHGKVTHLMGMWPSSKYLKRPTICPWRM